MNKIGVFGGTFSPVHSEHIALARFAKKQLNLDKLFVLPTYQSPHKKDMGAQPIDRLNMLKLAFKKEEKIEVSSFEIDRGEVSYSYITAEHFKKEYGAEVYMLVGADMLKDFKTWRYPERILNAVTLVACQRDDDRADITKEIEYIKNTFNKAVIELNFCGKAQSSTKIRTYASLSLDISDFTHKKVAEYIKEKGLYSGGELERFVSKTLPTKRLIHTANVYLCALKWAKKLNLDQDSVKTACLLHDIAKYQDASSYKGFTLEKDMPAPVVHAFLGAHIATEVLKINDKDIINAIKYHTSGRPNMSDLEKLVFVADMLEEGRDYEGVDKLRAIYEKDFSSSFIECLKEETIHLKNKKAEIYRLTIDAYEYYVKGDE